MKMNMLCTADVYLAFSFPFFYCPIISKLTPVFTNTMISVSVDILHKEVQIACVTQDSHFVSSSETLAGKPCLLSYHAGN